MKKIMILNGPNLNMLGIREPEIYGHETLDDARGVAEESAMSLGAEIDFRQTNYEGELVTWIQEARTGYDGLIINAGAYTHTSIAMLDALKVLEIPVVELHVTDPKQRESFRHLSYVEPVAQKCVSGQGIEGYGAAVEAILSL